MTYHATNTAGKRNIYDLSLMASSDPTEWEAAYNATMEEKYHKHKRNFNLGQYVTPYTGSPAPIYIVPRVRGGPSYKEVPLAGVTNDQVYYAPVSKGYPMQEVSSFSLGPVVGEGLCVVNAAFSKIITIAHIEGGGKVNFKRKYLWEPARNPLRQITLVDSEHILVDGTTYITKQWLSLNEHLWLQEWEYWRACVSLCSRGDFHWSNNSPIVSYRYQGIYLNRADWGKQCYIAPAYQLLPYTRVFQHLQQLHANNVPLGLVHPKGMKHEAEQPVTREEVRRLYDSPVEIACMPYVIVGAILHVPIYTPRLNIIDN